MSRHGPRTNLPGTASLLDQIDKTVLIELLDGRHLIGALRSFDQFGNVVLESTSERHYIHDKFADIPLGLYIVRGDHVVLLGEIDAEREKRLQSVLTKISPKEYLELKSKSAQKKTERPMA